jgi:Zn-dependent protease
LINFTVSQLLIRGCAVLFASTVQGLALAGAASALGDKSPRHQGRLTINPLQHADVVGGLVGLAFSIGWAKWITIDPRALRQGRASALAVVAAGFAALVLAIWVLRLVRPLILPLLPDTAASTTFVLIDTAMETCLWFALIGLVPVPPLMAGQLLVALVPAWRERDWRIDLGLEIGLGLLVATGIPADMLGPAFAALTPFVLGDRVGM